MKPGWRGTTRHVLLVEPYPELRDLLLELLDEAKCRVDVAMTGYEMNTAIKATTYDCVLLNLDQNREQNFGLDLAAEAAAAGARIILIPDHVADRTAIAAKGWLQLTKPYSVKDILAVLAQAIGPAGELSAVLARAEQERIDRGRDAAPS